MFARDARLDTKAFTQCFASGKRIHLRFATYILCPAAEGRLSCAVVVGKKVAKRAVVRNRLRRQVADVAKAALANETFSLIVILKPTAASLTRQARKQAFIEEFGELLKRR